jgi:hypothetical protein
MIITPNLGIPFKFYTKFELTRLNINDITITKINDNHKIMILSVYILAKILIKGVIIDTEMTNNKNKDLNQ